MLSYKGDARNLSTVFASDRWTTFLETHDLVWKDDTNTPGEWTGYPASWTDYVEVDLVVALRPDVEDPQYRKPASKLVNAWHAGVPALLPPEYAYRELRQSDLDYIEVRSLDDVMEGIRYLIEHPERYRAMIEHGHRRAEAFSVEAITERWARLLFETIPQRIDDGEVRAKQRWPLRLRQVANLVKHPPHSWEWRLWGYSLKQRLTSRG